MWRVGESEAVRAAGLSAAVADRSRLGAAVLLTVDPAKALRVVGAALGLPGR